MEAMRRTLAVRVCIILLLGPGLSCSDVLVNPKSQGVTGRSVTLPCRFTGSAQVTQVTWEKVTDLGTHMVAVRSREHGSSTHPFYGLRARFRSAASDPDASLIIEDVIMADAGRFRCKILTFPSGSFEKDTWLTVQVPPQVSVVPGPRALLEGDRRALAATCTATGSSPRANVSWKTLVPGEQEERVWINANNTVTISNRYYLDPVRAMRGQTLDCIVTHSTFTKAARLQHRLDVYYVPEVSVSASENWHVGAEGAELECAENGNPPATSFAWMRLYGSLPNNSVTQRNRLQFKGSLTLQDAGIYVCDVTNKIGTRSAQLEVRVTDENSSSVNMLSMSFVAIGAVGLVLLIILVISVIAVNRYHRKKTEDMVYKLEELTTMSRQPSIRRCNSTSISIEARLHDGGGSRENELEQDPMLVQIADQEGRSSSRDLLSGSGEAPRPAPALGSLRRSLRSTASERADSPAFPLGAHRSSLRETGIRRGEGPGNLPTTIAPGDPGDGTLDVAVRSDRVDSLTSRPLTASPSISESQTEDEDEVADRQQSIHTAMGHFYTHNGTLRPKSNGSKVYIARREHCV